VLEAAVCQREQLDTEDKVVPDMAVAVLVVVVVDMVVVDKVVAALVVLVPDTVVAPLDTAVAVED